MRRSLPWVEFKSTLQQRRAALQLTETAEAYKLSFFDGPVEFRTAIFKSTPPAGAGVSPADNASALAEFEASFKPVANLPVESRTSEAVPFVSTNIFPPWTALYFTGAGDGVTRGSGVPFALSRSEAGTSTQEFSFSDGVYAAGGGLFWRNANFGDWISLEAHCEGTPVVSTPGTGNCNLAEVPGVGAVLIVPAAGNGSHTVNLAAANLIPAVDDATGRGNGFWDWSDPWVGRGTITPTAVPGSGRWHLFTIHLVLGRFANRIPVLGGGHLPLQVDTIKPKYFPPHWHWNVTISRAETASPPLEISFYLMTARKQTI